MSDTDTGLGNKDARNEPIIASSFLPSKCSRFKTQWKLSTHTVVPYVVFGSTALSLLLSSQENIIRRREKKLFPVSRPERMFVILLVVLCTCNYEIKKMHMEIMNTAYRVRSNTFLFSLTRITTTPKQY